MKVVTLLVIASIIAENLAGRHHPHLEYGPPDGKIIQFKKPAIIYGPPDIVEPITVPSPVYGVPVIPVQPDIPSEETNENENELTDVVPPKELDIEEIKTIIDTFIADTTTTEQPEESVTSVSEIPTTTTTEKPIVVPDIIYGPPTKPPTEYGIPTTTTTTTIHPVVPEVTYGPPIKPPIVYGVPVEPVTKPSLEYGPPPVQHPEYGLPINKIETKPFDDYGPPLDQSHQPFKVPIVPAKTYGVPDKSFPYPPSGVPQTVDVEEYNGLDRLSKVFREITTHQKPIHVKSFNEYGVPFKHETSFRKQIVVPARTYGPPQYKFFVPHYGHVIVHNPILRRRRSRRRFSRN